MAPHATRATTRLAVLASGRGSNLQALLDAIAAGSLPAEVVGVFSDKPAAPALAMVPEALRWSARPRDHADREAFDAALADAVAAVSPDWVVCAGYMRILGTGFIARFAGRLLNIHPSLLPSFPGLHTHQRALDEGVRIHGCTVHFVTAELDHGPVVIQAAVPVIDGDDEASLAARILVQEHRIYPQAVRWFVEGRLTLAGQRVQVDGGSADGALVCPR